MGVPDFIAFPSGTGARRSLVCQQEQGRHRGADRQGVGPACRRRHGLIQRELRRGVLLALASADKGPEVLLGIEQEIARSYEGERLLQFCSGRALARRLLQILGGSACSVARKNNGAPLWPKGFTGSLSHSGELVGAIVGRSADCFGLGLDIERPGRIDSSLWPLLFTPTEQVFLAGQSPAEQDFLATAFFSIKEAFLKLPSPREYLVEDYQDVEVRFLERRYSLHGAKTDFRLHFGCHALSAEVFRHRAYLVAYILLDDMDSEAG
jgi:4'-phosphopantetheinyl transferase EntD